MAVTTFMSPIVTFAEIDQSTYVAQSAIGSIGGTVGTFQWGPVDKVISVGDERSLADTFGLPFYKKSTPELNRYIDWFSCSNFLSYSRNLKVARCCYPHAKNAQVQLHYEFLVDPYGDVIGLDTNEPIYQLTMDIQDETLVRNDEEFSVVLPTLEKNKIAFIAKYPGCFPEGIVIAIAGNDGFKMVKDEIGERLSENPLYAEWIPGSLGTPNYIKVTIIHPNHNFLPGDKILIKGLTYTTNGISPSDFNAVHTIDSIDSFTFDHLMATGHSVTTIGYSFRIPYVGANPGGNWSRYYPGDSSNTSGFYSGHVNTTSGLWEWKARNPSTSLVYYTSTVNADCIIFADIDGLNSADYTQFGKDDIFIYRHSNYWPQAYKNIFTSEPVPGEFHILLIDPTGEISGTKLPGTILEKFSNVSIQPAKKYDGSSNYISNVINRGSKFVNVCDTSYLTDDFIHDNLILQGGEDSTYNYAYPEGSSFNILGKRTFFDFVNMTIVFGTVTPYPANRQYSHIAFRQFKHLYQSGDAINVSGYQCKWGKDPNTWNYGANVLNNKAEYEKQYYLNGKAIRWPVTTTSQLLSPLGTFSKTEDERVNSKAGSARTIVHADDDYYFVEMNPVKVIYPTLNITVVNDTGASWSDPALIDPDTGVNAITTASGGNGTNVRMMVGCGLKNSSWYNGLALFNAGSSTSFPAKPKHYLHDIFGSSVQLMLKCRVTISHAEGRGYSTSEVWAEVVGENELMFYYVDPNYVGYFNVPIKFPWGTSNLDSAGDHKAAYKFNIGTTTYTAILGQQTFPVTGGVAGTSGASANDCPWMAWDNTPLEWNPSVRAADKYQGSLGFVEILEFWDNNASPTAKQIPLPTLNTLNSLPCTDLVNNENVSIADNDIQQNILRVKIMDSTNTGSLAMRMKTWDIFLDEDTVDANLLFMGEGGPELGKYVTENICLVRKDCITVIDPFYSDVVNVASPANIVTNLKNTRNMIGSYSYATMVSCWKYQYDKFNDEYHWLPLGGDICGLMSRVDYDYFPWYSPAGLNRGQIKNTIKLSHHEPLYMRDELYTNGINPVVSFPNEGVVLYGDKTLQAKPSAFDRINVRRSFIYFERSIVKFSRYYLFEINDAYTRETMRQAIGSFMAWVKANRGCYAYKVVCDESNNPPEVIDRNELYADIFIQPVKSINFIQLNFIATRTGASMTLVGQGNT